MSPSSYNNLPLVCSDTDGWKGRGKIGVATGITGDDRRR